MLTKRQTIKLWFLTVAAFLVWTLGGWLVLQHQPDGSPLIQWYSGAAVGILLFGVLLTFSIVFSSLFHLMFVATRADDIVRKNGHVLYCVFWRELQDHIDNCVKASPK
ncbi:hypothetical protein [Mesorhizobium sp. KR9-304]|uniref:hypothetical protein n=1 Tax=Mesorhizobium sp. KR9-304 TaxID=3156614 RepID=UPI0032B40ED1